MSQTSTHFRIQLPLWARQSHPVYHQESQRHSASRGLAVLQLIFLPILFGMTALAMLGAVSMMLPLIFGTNVDAVLVGMLSVTLGILASVQLGAGALGNVMVITQVSPVISGEVELQSWRLLRTTTMPIHEIIFAKFTAALMHLRVLLGGLMILRLITTITAVLLFLLTVLRTSVYGLGPDDASQYYLQLKWLPLMVPLVAVLIAYLFQPVVQFLLNGSIGLLASSYARSRGQAIAGSLMLRLGLWAFTLLFHIAAISTLTAFVSGWAAPDYASIQSLRALPTPSPEAITWAWSLLIAAYAVSVLTWQIGLSFVSLGLALRRARQLGV